MKEIDSVYELFKQKLCKIPTIACHINFMIWKQKEVNYL